MPPTTGLCRHCGKPDAPVTADGYLGTHWRADNPGTVCGSAVLLLRPDRACEHVLPVTHKTCRSDQTGPRS